jgi:Transposase DDE domain
MFTRIDAGDVPDAKTILKIARALGPDIIEQLHRQVVEVAKRAGVTHGRRFRIDTTVVETNVHYPTDSTLLQDAVRVLTRTMQRASTALGDRPGRIRNRLRSVTRRVLMIGYAARSPKTRAALVKSYRTLMATTRAVLRDTATMVRRLGQRRRTAPLQVQPILQRAQDQLQAMRPRVQRVVSQTRARVLGGDTHVPDKVLSVFEPHTATIRKGKIAKPNEFGQLVTIQESEHQIIAAYEVHAGRPADVTLWTPALDRHQTTFGRAPDLAAGDRGFSSAANEQAAIDRGVRRVILPRRGQKSPARRAYERQRWFRRGQRWRVGSEGRISVLKRRHGLDRCRYHGLDGMNRWVGLGVIANNLVSTATFSRARATA